MHARSMTAMVKRARFAFTISVPFSGRIVTL
jgi:hypothetical protein